MSSTTYEEIMGMMNNNSNKSAADALSDRLVRFRRWLKDDCQATVHPAVCVVNGEATDGTKNAPVLVFERSEAAIRADADPNKFDGRVGIVDGDSSTALYDRTMGCQVRATREIKKGDAVLTLPRACMITPDLVASSDAGKAVLACCKAIDTNLSFWDALENTTVCESKFTPKVSRNTGPQTLVKILQERKKAESAYKRSGTGEEKAYKLAEPGTVSTRAPFLAFLIHQRFLNAERAPVALDRFDDTSEEGNALRSTEVPIQVPPGAPTSFSPYARTLPSSVSLPLCWKRNELALLAACIPGLNVLHEVASSTLQLVQEFSALLDAGILERFPSTFPPGLLTWERWVWAAAVFSSRNLPATSYLNAGDENAAAFRPLDPLEFQSPPEIWGELGVLVPLLDMLNHEAEEHQITWQPQMKGDENGNAAELPRAVLHKKVKKGSEIYCCYGNLSNRSLMLQYGFAQMSNLSDEVRLGWALADAVGNVDPPFDFTPPFTTGPDDVYESNDESATNAWWTEDRVKLLETEVFSTADKPFLASLKAGRKMTATAYGDGNYHPILLSSAVIATISSKNLRKYTSIKQGGVRSGKFVITKRHQQALQRYLQFIFTRKLEKLLQNLDNGLKGHFANVKLWTKASDGGLSYQPPEDENGAGYTGWQSFFDANAYKTAMEVENRYYAMGIESCVLALYDGQLRALQASVSGVSTESAFATGVLQQLEDIGFEVSNEDDKEEEDINDDRKGNDDSHSSPVAETQNGSESKSPSPKSRAKRNRGKKTSSDAGSVDKPPAVKLHVGNLSYSTTPADLYEYFSSIYGQANVLECHIPIERDTGRSRGFGFVAMPEEIAQSALQSGKEHEVDGRILKVARSNSAGSVSSVKSPEGPPPHASDRCLTCGYRPKFCLCQRPNIPGYNGPPPPGGAAHLPPHSAVARGGGYHEPTPRDYGGRDSRDWHYGPPRRDDRRGRDYYDDGGDWHRDYDRDRRSHRYEDDYRARSYDRDDDNYRERSRRDRDRGRSRDRSPGSRGSNSRRWEHDERERSSSRRDRDRKGEPDDYDRPRKRSRSRSRDKSRRKKSKRRNRSRSRSLSPPPFEGKK